LSEDLAMNGSNDMATRPLPLPASTHRRFYFYAVLGAATVVFVGFAQSYFLKRFFGTPPLYPLLHLHGFIMTSWFVLFATQTWLIEAHRVRLHRRLGIFGALLAATILIVGAAVVTINAREGRVPPAAPIAVIVLLSYANLMAFGVLVGAAIYSRGSSEFHKRLMLLATLNLLPAAVSRIPLHFIESGGLLTVFGLPDLFIVVCVVYDTFRHRRLHPAFAWGAILSIVWPVAGIVMGGSSAWGTIATWLISKGA
jgi:hypothetical protein